MRLAQGRGSTERPQSEAWRDASDSEAPSPLLRALKVVILLVLLATAGISAGVAYKQGARARLFTQSHHAEPQTTHRACTPPAGRASELHSFSLQFDASVVQLHADFQTRLNTLVKTAEMGALLRDSREGS